MTADRHRLRQMLRTLEHQAKKGENLDGRLDQLRRQLDRSLAAVARRREALGPITFDPSLPINARREEIEETIRRNQVVVICGETGSGKSTQLPKICLDIGRGVQGLIGHTQPRRIAARSVAGRVAEELNTSVGALVGYKVRFSDQTGPETMVKLMTDGILLAESQNDRFFDAYDTIIIDEAHERSLNIDFLLGMMKRLLRKRRDLKLIITSATIDAKRFADHFSSHGEAAPVLEVSGRTWPIETRYRPLGEEEEESEDPDWDRAILRAVDEVAAIDRGDILIFMPTERDIHETAKSLRGHRISGDSPGRETQILPLYARLPAGEQQKIFRPSGHRRIVIATNVAESSLTVPGIRYVIDPGTARISRYSTRSKTQRLPIERVSRASADQRAGRCGRVGPGICIRLYSEADYQARDRYTTPEIQRTNLASVILRTKSLRLGAIEKFPFLEPPRGAAIRDGYKTLFELGALDEKDRLTSIGKQLAQMPIDPRLGRIILAGHEEGCLAEVLIIASALEIQDPRERPLEKQQAADTAHEPFVDEQSDFLGYLKLWDFYHQLKEKLSRNQLRKACRQNFLSYNRMREWSDIHRQLLELIRQSRLLEDAKSRENGPQRKGSPRRSRLKLHRTGDYGAIHRALLTGLLSGVSMRSERYEFTVQGGGKFFLWPGSGLFKNKAPWVLAAERVETSKRYLRTVARIEPEWIEPLAEHLVKRTYHDPTWSKKQGAAMIHEQVTLFGLPIVPRRRKTLGPIDPTTARLLFIRQGLVEGEIDASFDFLEHNQNLVEEARSLQAKLRRHDLLLGDWVIEEFYESRLPEEVIDVASLRHWLKKASSEHRRRLELQLDDLTREAVAPEVRKFYPDKMQTGSGLEIPLEYRMEPGEVRDGLSVVVPLEGLPQLDAAQLGWLVPGLLQERVVAMLRTLPKPIRRNLVPIPDTAKKVVEMLPFGHGSLEAALARAVSQLAGQIVSPDDFDLSRLPENLRMNIRVLDAEGEELATGRDLETLRRELGVKAAESVTAIDDPRWNQKGLTEWNFGELPESIELDRAGMPVTAHPSLVDEGETVALQLSDTPARAQMRTRLGLMRLAHLAYRRDLRTQAQWLPKFDQLMTFAQSLPEFSLKQQVAEWIALRAMQVDELPIPRDEEQFQTRLSACRERIGLAVQEVTKLIVPLLENHHRARLAIEQLPSDRYAPTIRDVKTQIKELTRPGFLLQTPWRWLKEYPRFFQAIEVRLDRLRSGSQAKDQEMIEEIRSYWDDYEELRRSHEASGIFDPELMHFRWMLEEYRVSLFAQRLGTSLKVSNVRLEKQWSKVRR
jgi:ATP-dependent helicase HrpA